MAKSPSHQRLVIINNLPTPYRIHFFNTVHHQLAQRGIDFEVWFMAETEPGRYWSLDREAWQFNGRIFGGLHPQLRGIPMHINPGMWRELLVNPPTWVVLAGGWHLPTSLGVSLLRRRGTALLLWSEANLSTSRYKRGLPAQYRRWMLRRSAALVIPGNVARTTITEGWGVRDKHFILLPNLVDESKFGHDVERLRQDRAALRTKLNLPHDRHVLFWSARLLNKSKGLLNFLNAVAGLPVIICLAGDGADRPLVEAWIAAHPQVDVRLLGHLPQEKLLEYLASADAAVLPSLLDPNPLANIEALWAGLPLLTSIYCGNYPEVVEHEVNGWLVDAADAAQLRAAVATIAATPFERLRQMGRRSRELAELRFASAKATNAFIDDLIALQTGQPLPSDTLRG